MRITVFGAAGAVGSRVVAEALSRGHEVTAVVRDSARFAELPERAYARTGDASNVEDVVRASAGQDVVIGATRPAPGSGRQLVSVAEALLAGVARTGGRLLLVGGAASLTVPGSGGYKLSETPTSRRHCTRSRRRAPNSSRRARTTNSASIGPTSARLPR